MRRRKVSSSFSVTTIHDGNDGYNNAVVTIYQRKASAPSVPSSALIYSFVTGLLTPASSLSGWSLSIPDVDGNPCWVTQASVRSKDSSVTIGSADWGTVRKLVEDGKNSIRLDLSNEHENFLYDDAGNNRSGSATSQARLYDGITEVNANDVNWSIDATKSSGVLIDASSSDFSTKGTSVSSAGLLTVKALTAAVAKVTVKAEYPKSSGKCYYAEFTANKTSQDKYDLVIKPNSIAYNPISYTTQTIAVSAKRLDLSGTPSTATISTTSGSGMLRLFRSYVNSNGTLTTAEQLTSLSQSIDSTTANSYAGIYFELRKYVNASGNNSSSYSVADYETVPITKAQNGAHGDTPITAYRWYKSGLTPTKPTDVSADMPDAVDYLNDGTNAQPTAAWSDTAPNRPADGWHLWIVQSTKHTAANGNVTRDAWSDPVRISGDKGSPGEDAAGREWIYKLSSSSAPSIPSTSTNTDGYVPSGWTNHPTGIDATNIYEYACYRDKAAGTGTRSWSAWKGKTGGATGDTPILWSHWGRNGMDGDGTEYVFIRTKGYTKPSIYDSNANDSNSKAYTADDYLPSAYISEGQIEKNALARSSDQGGLIGECTDDPKGTDSTWRYEWVVKRTKGVAGTDGVRNWVKYSGQMALWSKWAEDGVSPIFADLTNEHDGVMCDKQGYTTGGEQSVATKVNIWKGPAEQSISSVACSIDGTTLYNGYTTNADDSRHFKYSFNTTTKILTVYVKEGALVSIKEIAITVNSTIDGENVSRDLQLTITGNKPGADGTPATVYNLIPSVQVVSRDSDAIPLSDTISFKVSKKVGNSVSEVANWQTEGLTLYHNIGGADVSDGTVNGAKKTVSGIQNGLYAENDEVEWILKKDSTVLDREGVGSVNNGSDGGDGLDAVKAMFSPSTIFVEADEDGWSIDYDQNFNINPWVELNGSNIGFNSISIIESPVGVNASYNTSTGLIQISVSSGTDYVDYEGEVRVRLRATNGGISYNTTGSIPVVKNVKGKQGIPGGIGKTGPMYYPAGYWSPIVRYNKGTNLCPVVMFLKKDGGDNCFWALVASTAYGESQSPANEGRGSGSAILWEKAIDFNLVIAKALFADFAQIGSAIFTGDWMISTNGTIGGNLYENGDEYNGLAAYTYFDPIFPCGAGKTNLFEGSMPVYKSYTDGWTQLTEKFSLKASRSYKFLAVVNVGYMDWGKDGYSYGRVNSPTGNPKENGWYTRSGTAGAYVFTATTDTSIVSSKTYFFRYTIHLRLFGGTTTKDAWYLGGTQTADEDVVIEKTLTNVDDRDDYAIYAGAAIGNTGTRYYDSTVKLIVLECTTNDIFVPKYCVDLRTGKVSMGGGTIQAQKNGDVMIKGALMYSRIIQDRMVKVNEDQTVSPTAYTFYLSQGIYQGNIANPVIRANYINIVGSVAYASQNKYIVNLPPARFFEGMELTILNNVRGSSGWELIPLTFRVPSEFNTTDPILDDTNALVAMTWNRFAVLLTSPYVYEGADGGISGTHLVASNVRSVKLIAARHPYIDYYHNGASYADKCIAWCVVEVIGGS